MRSVIHCGITVYVRNTVEESPRDVSPELGMLDRSIEQGRGNKGTRDKLRKRDRRNFERTFTNNQIQQEDFSSSVRRGLNSWDSQKL